MVLSTGAYIHRKAIWVNNKLLQHASNRKCTSFRIIAFPLRRILKTAEILEDNFSLLPCTTTPGFDSWLEVFQGPGSNTAAMLQPRVDASFD